MLLEYCISVYNKTAEELNRCLASIPVNDNYGVRIDVDGCKLDYLIEDLEGYKRFKNIRCLYHSVNRGLGAIRNQQIDECTAKYIQFIDADDKLLCEIPITEHNNEEVIVSPIELVSNKSFIEYRNIEISKGRRQSLFVIPSLILQTKFLNFYNLRFDTSRMLFEDVIFSVRLSYLVIRYGSWSKPYYSYLSETSGSLSHPKDKNKIIKSTEYVINELYKLTKEAYTTYDKLNLIYDRIIEECLRVLSIDGLDKQVKDRFINYMKPYKFYKE